MNAIKIDSIVTKTNSAVWVTIMKPKQQSINIRCLYHPKSKTNEDSTNTIDYLITILTKPSDGYENSKFILCRDFNHLSMEAVSEAFRVWKLVDFATRRNACLDNIYSDISQYNKLCNNYLRSLVMRTITVVFPYYHAIQKDTSISIS